MRQLSFASTLLTCAGFALLLASGACAPKSKLPGSIRDNLCWFRGKDKTGAPVYHELKSAPNLETCAVLLEIQRQKGNLASVRGSFHQIDVIVDQASARAALKPGFWALLLARGPDGKLVLPNQQPGR